jgi:hypothetical protein
MKIKSNIRAGAGVKSGGASGAGKNSASDVVPSVIETPPAPVVYYPVARCAGL